MFRAWVETMDLLQLMEVVEPQITSIVLTEGPIRLRELSRVSLQVVTP